jgi:hypothetical protein
MPYREKTAWLSLVAMATSFGPYFTLVNFGHPAGGKPPNLPQLAFFAGAAIVQMLILGLGHLYFAHKSPEEAHTPPDERDRAIMTRSITFAYYVLIVGMMLVGCVMPFNSGGWTIINAALATIVAAEIVHYGVIVLSYRSQS